MHAFLLVNTEISDKSVATFDRLLRSAIFCGLLVLLCVIVAFVCRPRFGGAMGDPWVGYFRQEPHSVEIISVGNALSECGWQPQFAWKKQGVISWNLGADALSAQGCPQYIKAALTTQEPKIILVEISPFFSRQSAAGSEEESFRLDEQRFNRCYPFLQGKDDFFAQYRPSEWSVELLPLLCYMQDKNGVTFQKAKNILRTRERECRGGSLPASSFFSENLKGKIPTTVMSRAADETAFKEHQDSLSATIRLCKRSNIKLLMWEAPSESASASNRVEIIQSFVARNIPKTQSFINYVSFVKSGDDTNDFQNNECITDRLLRESGALVKLRNQRGNSKLSRRWDKYAQVSLHAPGK